MIGDGRRAGKRLVRPSGTIFIHGFIAKDDADIGTGDNRNNLPQPGAAVVYGRFRADPRRGQLVGAVGATRHFSPTLRGVPI
jgi:hypothetical protein